MSIGRLETAAAQGASTLLLVWDDGHRATLDLTPIIAAHPVLAPLADAALFQRVQLSSDGWSLEWPDCEIDFGAQQLRRWADEQSGRAMPRDAFRAWVERHHFTQDAAAEALGLSRRTIAYYLSGERPIPRTVLLATHGYDHQQAA